MVVWGFGRGRPAIQMWIGQRRDPPSEAAKAGPSLQLPKVPTLSDPAKPASHAGPEVLLGCITQGERKGVLGVSTGVVHRAAHRGCFLGQLCIQDRTSFFA